MFYNDLRSVDCTYYFQLTSLFSRSYSSYSKVRGGLIRITFWSSIWDQCTVHMYISMWVKLQASKCFQNRVSLGSESWSQILFVRCLTWFQKWSAGLQARSTTWANTWLSWWIFCTLSSTQGALTSMQFICDSAVCMYDGEKPAFSTWIIMAPSHEPIPISALRIMRHFASLFDNLLECPCKQSFSALNDLAYRILFWNSIKLNELIIDRWSLK